MGGYSRFIRDQSKTVALLRKGGGAGEEMIQLHKWFPFVFPSPRDIKAEAVEKRIERLEYEHHLEVEAEKMRKKVDEYDLELYNKRARENTIDIEIFSNKRHFDKFV